MNSDGGRRQYRRDTLATHLGRHPEAQMGAVNPPVYHASTIRAPSMVEWEARHDPANRFAPAAASRRPITTR
jgi:cystathionine beta-lyase